MILLLLLDSRAKVSVAEKGKCKDIIEPRSIHVRRSEQRRIKLSRFSLLLLLLLFIVVALYTNTICSRCGTHREISTRSIGFSYTYYIHRISRKQNQNKSNGEWNVFFKFDEGVLRVCLSLLLLLLFFFYLPTLLTIWYFIIHVTRLVQQQDTHTTTNTNTYDK